MMCFFKKRKKAQTKIAENQIQVPVSKPDAILIPSETPVEIPVSEPTEPVVEPVAAPAEPVIEQPIQEPVPAKTEPEAVNVSEAAKPKKTPKTTEKDIKTEASTTRYSGKYEIYPEAGGFKFRLKASNGEILVVSQVYASKAGATSGIETFKKNVETGAFEFYTDKSNFTQLMIYTPNKSRLIATGEFYESVQRSNSAAESVKKFYTTDKIASLDAVDPSDVREELVDLQPVEAKANGKFDFFEETGQFMYRLKASNGEVLFTSNGYSSKASAVQGLEVVKKAIEAGSFHVKKDKQGRYQFELYALNKSMLITGETYPNKDSCMSALDSVRRFYQKAKIVE